MRMLMLRKRRRHRFLLRPRVHHLLMLMLEFIQGQMERQLQEELIQLLFEFDILGVPRGRGRWWVNRIDSKDDFR